MMGTAALRRSVRVIAIAVAVAVGTFTLSSTVSAQSEPPETTDAQYEQAFRAEIGPQADALVRGLLQQVRRAGLEPGNGSVGPAEVHRVGPTDIEKALLYLAKLLSDSSYVAGLGFVLSALFKYFAHKTDPQRVPVAVYVLFTFAALGWLIAWFESITPPILDAQSFTTDLEPLLRDAARSADGKRPQLPADAESTLRTNLRSRGLTGDALEAFTQLELATAGILIADARA